MENGIFIKFLVGGFYRESIVAISEFKYLCFEVWVGCVLCILRALGIHNISSLSRVGHLHLGR